MHELFTALQSTGEVVCEVLTNVAPEYVSKFLPHTDDWAELNIRGFQKTSDEVFFDCGYSIRVMLRSEEQFVAFLRDRVNSFGASVVMTGQRNAIVLIKSLADLDIPLLLNLDTLPGQGVYSVSDLITALSNRAQLLCCSRFLQQRILQLCKADSFLLYPIIPRCRYRTDATRGQAITCINPLEIKGGTLLPEIVARLPRTQFLLVEGWELENQFWNELVRRYNSAPNVVIQRRVADMKLVYSQTRLLLVPSQWEEALGRVVFEANCSGIPAIVSQIGGLPEILGFGGLSIGDYSNVDAWVAALLSAQCPEKMDSLRVGARLNGARDDFSPQKVAGRFLEILSDGCRK